MPFDAKREKQRAASAFRLVKWLDGDGRKLPVNEAGIVMHIRKRSASTRTCTVRFPKVLVASTPGSTPASAQASKPPGKATNVPSR